MSQQPGDSITNEDLSRQIESLRVQQAQFVTHAEVRDTYATKDDLATQMQSIRDDIATMPQAISLEVFRQISGQVHALAQDAIQSASKEYRHWAREDVIAAVAEYDRTPAALEAHKARRVAIREEERRERREDMQTAIKGIYTGLSRLQKAVVFSIPFITFLMGLIGVIGLIRSIW